MKVLHLPMDLAAQLSLAVKALKLININATSAAYKHPFGYPIDIKIPVVKNSILNRIIRAKYFLKFFLKYDIYHFYAGSSLLPFAIDVRLYKLFKKKILVEFCGSDIRISDFEQKRNPYTFVKKSNVNPEKRMSRWAGLTNGVAVVGDHSFNKQLLRHFATVYIVGQRTRVNEILPVYSQGSGKIPVIVHAPSDYIAKGSPYLETALENLKSKGVKFEYIRVQGMCHDEAMKAYAKADLIVDQLRTGSHGVVSCEGMAMGKPVICYIMDDMKDEYPAGFPIINANPDTIEDVLLKFISSPDTWQGQGRLGREYVEKIHDPLRVAKRLKVIYENTLNNNHPKGIVDLREIFCD